MAERIREMLDDKINEIFLAIQTEEGIESGDVSFELEYDINRLEEKLAAVIARAIAEQKN